MVGFFSGLCYRLYYDGFRIYFLFSPQLTRSLSQNNEVATVNNTVSYINDNTSLQFFLFATSLPLL